MGVSENEGTQQPWVFLLKMMILGCEMGVPPFKETPIWQLWMFFLFPEITLPNKFHRTFFFSEKQPKLIWNSRPFDSPKTSSYLAQLPSQQALKDFDAASGMLSN